MDETTGSDASDAQEPNEAWTRYGGALIGAMLEVLQEAGDELHPLLLETADFWRSFGLAIGVDRPGDAGALLELITEHDADRDLLTTDGETFCREVLG